MIRMITAIQIALTGLSVRTRITQGTAPMIGPKYGMMFVTQITAASRG